jgi:sec-independent protein translocase protein TatB
MFDHVGWGELMVVIVLALIVFGPDKLPKFAADAARMLRQLRRMANNATSELREELGPELGDLNDLRDLRELRELRDLHPRRLIGRTLFDDPDGDDAAYAADGMPEPVAPRSASAPLGEGEAPPYDPDAT